MVSHVSNEEWPTGIGQVAQLVSRLVSWLQILPPSDQRMSALMAALQEEHSGDCEPVSQQSLSRIEATAHRYCRHFALELHAAGDLAVDTTSRGWPPPDPQEVRRRAAFFSKVERTDDGIAVVAIDNLDPLELARPYLDGSAALTVGASGLVLDLRRNGGGDPGTVAQILSWLTGPGQHISDVIYRQRTRQWWTTAWPESQMLPPATPVAAMISERTFSSGEALAYHLQSLGRATLIGQQTPGAADHITPINLTRHVRGFLPEAHVIDARTHTNWEGSGVVPDVPCAPEETEATALAWVLP